MESYVGELRGALRAARGRGGALAAVDAERAAISGHSMGGHGALTLALKAAAAAAAGGGGAGAAPRPFASASAFAPICHPSNCPWGRKAFDGYLDGGVAEGAARHDAVELLRAAAAADGASAGESAAAAALRALPLLVDQGAADGFLPPSESNGPAGQLQPDALAAALAALGRAPGADDDAASLTRVRAHEGYDHSYFFISSFIDEHIAFHARHLAREI